MADETVVLDDVRNVTNEELIARLRSLARADQALNARLLVHLGEVEARGLHRDLAYSSMFEYCVEELHMFEHQAYLRIQTARLGRKFPLILQLLAQGSLTLTTIKRIGPHLTEDNHVQLLERVSGKGTRGVELVLAEIAPKPDVPSRMRKLPEPSTRKVTTPELQFTPASVESGPITCTLEASLAPPSNATQPSPIDVKPTPIALPEVRDSNRAAFALEAPRQRASAKPLSPGRYKVEFTASKRCMTS